MSRKRKVLILTAGYGEGHNTAAKSVCAGIEAVANGEAEARVLDLFAMSYGRSNDLSRKAYIGVINNAPRVWQKFYELLDTTRLVEGTLFTLSKMSRLLAKIIAEEKPDAIVSTYPIYSFLLERLYPRGRNFVFLTVVTDSITINSVWHRAPSDYFLLPNEDTAAVMKRAGVPAEKMKVLGFPVTPRFAKEAIERPAPSASTRPRVLFMINFAHGEAPALLGRLLENPAIDVTVTVGRDEALGARIAETARQAKREVEIFGWTDRMPELVMRSHLLISKAGGATVQETTAAKTPMIISQVVPGQEEGNAQLIVENGCGRVAQTHEKIAATVAEAFKDNAALWKTWEANITKISRPGAALAIADFILGK